MATKRGGAKAAPVATTPVATGAPVSPAEDKTQTDALVSLVEGAPIVEALTEAVADADEGADSAKAESTVEDTPDDSALDGLDAGAARIAAIAALTGAVPATSTSTLLPTPVVEPTGKHVRWADGDQQLVAAVVAVTSYQGTIDGARVCAFKGETLHASEEVIARGVQLGALVRAD